MAETVRELVVKVTFEADTSDLGDFNSAQEESVAGSVAFGTAIGNAAVSLGKFAVSAVRGAAGALRDMVSAQVEARDEVAKTANNLDITAESLQELGFAAEQSGANSATIEKGLFTIAKQLDAAAAGSKTAIEAFDTLGVSRRELEDALAEGDGVKVMQLMAEGFATTEKGAPRTAAAMLTMGRAGKELGALLEGGPGALEDLAEQARATGNVFSGEALADFEKFADEQNRLSHQIEGVKGRIVGAALPALTRFTEGISGVIAENSDFIEQDLPELIGLVAQAAQDFIPIVIEWAKEAKTLFDQWQQLREDMENTDTTIGSITETIRGLIDVVNTLNNALPGPIKSLEKLLDLQEAESVERGPARFKGESDAAFAERRVAAKAASDAKKRRKAEADERIADALDISEKQRKLVERSLKGVEREEEASRRRRRAARSKAGTGGAKGAGAKGGTGKGAIGLAGRKSITAEELFKLGDLIAEGEAEGIEDAKTGGSVGGQLSRPEPTRAPPSFSSREGRGASPTRSVNASTVINAPFQPTTNVNINVDGANLVDLGPDRQGTALTAAVKQELERIFREQESHFQRTTKGL